MLVAEASAAAVFAASLTAEHRMTASLSSVSAPVPASTPGTRRMLHPVSLGGSRTDALLTRVGADFDGAVAAVERFWGADWTREVVVVATGTDAQFAEQARLDPHRQWNDIAAVSVADQVDPARREASGQRIVLAPGASDMSDDALRIVLTHELFHLAARRDTALDAPNWLLEGVADFVARPPEPLPPGAGADPALPSDADLEQPGAGRSAGYDRAWWFARFVADSYGVDGLHRLYQRAASPGHPDLDTAVRDALGADLSEVSARWAVWLNR